MDNTNDTMDQTQQHPGDVYARAEIEAWYAQRLRFAEVELQAATGAGIAALGGVGSRPEALRRSTDAQAHMEEMEASYQRWSTYGTIPPEHSARVSRVIGSIQGGLGAAFGPPVTVTASEQALLELGLDTSIEPDGQLAPALESALGLPASDPTRPPTEWQLADREYRARRAVGYEAMGRMGLYRDGEPWTAEQHARYARECAEGDLARIGSGWNPMDVDDVRESARQAAGLAPTGRDRLTAVYSGQDEARAYAATVHERLVETAAEVTAIAMDLERRLADEEMSPAARFEAGLVLADVQATAQLTRAASEASTGQYPKYVDQVEKELRRAGE